jgi:bifunctional non-homologous end joining protein LigD
MLSSPFQGFATSTLSLINPVLRAEPFDHPDWVFEAKLDGFRAAADTVRGRLISRNGNRMRRFEAVLDLLPPGLVLDGELVVLDDAGRPLFNKLLFGHRRLTYVAFDLLMADGVDLRPLSLSDRKARLAEIAKCPEGWIALTDGVVGAGRALYRAVVDADLCLTSFCGPVNSGAFNQSASSLAQVGRMR